MRKLHWISIAVITLPLAVAGACGGDDTAAPGTSGSSGKGGSSTSSTTSTTATTGTTGGTGGGGSGGTGGTGGTTAGTGGAGTGGALDAGSDRTLPDVVDIPDHVLPDVVPSG